MIQLLKLSTAADITVLMIDSADHITGKTGLSAGLTIYATKAGGTPATITPTVTELDATNVKGLYKLAFTTTHTNTLGELQIHITATGADPTDVWFQVVSELPGQLAAAAISSGTFASGAIDNAAIASNAIGAAEIANDAITAAKIATGAIDADALATDAVNEIADGVWDELLSGHTTTGSAGKALSDASAAGDPWDVSLPGAYASGKAGFILGTFLDQAISDTEAAIIAAIPTAAENATELLDQSAGVETNRTVRQAMRLILAAMAGRLSGALTTTVTIRDTNNTKNRIVATVDSSGNRTSLTYDQS